MERFEKKTDFESFMKDHPGIKKEMRRHKKEKNKPAGFISPDEKELVLPKYLKKEEDQYDNGLTTINPTPYMFRNTFDFKWDKIKDKAIQHLKQSEQIIKDQKLNTPERDGGVTTVPLLGCAKMENGKQIPFQAPHDWPEFADFIEWVKPNIDQVWNAWKLDPNMMKYISMSWMNCHPKGGFTDVHHHHNVVVAMACYLHVPEGSGNLMIKNPLSVHNYAMPVDEHYYDNEGEWEVVPVKTGDVFFFPGWLDHKTEVNPTDNNRYIMSINVQYEFPQVQLPNGSGRQS